MMQPWLPMSKFMAKSPRVSFPLILPHTNTYASRENKEVQKGQSRYRVVKLGSTLLTATKQQANHPVARRARAKASERSDGLTPMRIWYCSLLALWFNV